MTIDRSKWRKEILRRMPKEMRNVYHGFTVGPGWLALVCDLADRLDTFKHPYVILQVKEKFAELRFYVSAKGAPKEFFAAINKAEEESLKICEDCGGAGKVRGDAWIRTLCKPCDVKFLKGRERWGL